MPQVTVQQAMQVALQHHQSGRLRQAEEIYRQILAGQPEHVDAMQNLALIARQAGRNDIAVGLLRRAIALNTNSPEAHNNLGAVLLNEGQLDEAIAACRRAIVLRPEFAEAHVNLGNALRDKRQFDEAVEAYRRAIALRPGYAEAYSNLGNALLDQRRPDQAIGAYRQAIGLRPEYAEAHRNLGAGLLAQGQIDQAIAAYRQAIALRPGFAQAHGDLGNALREKGQFDQAIAACRQAIALQPGYAQAYDHLGLALHGQGRLDEAIAACRQAIALRPVLAEAHSNLGNMLRDQGQLDQAIVAHRQAIALNLELPKSHSNFGAALGDNGQLDDAISAYRQAIALKPELPAPHYNLALALLARGDFPEGWEEHEWRWQCKDFQLQQRDFPQPRWDGRPLRDRTLLIHAEQGLGDALQFIRYLPMVAERCRKVIFECQPELERLLRTTGYPIVARGQSLPAFDLHCPLLSLPRIFGTTLGSIPAQVPYLLPDAPLIESWRQKLAGSAAGPKVALAWAGNPNFREDRTRSMSLDRLGPVLRFRGATFHSLQKGEAARQADQPPAGPRLLNLGPALHDFADTAAVMCLMDLIITTDTSVAHLAGALGRPVWVMLRFVPDWRWLRDREDSPWYPSMRLFRQPSRGDWNSVIGRVADELSDWIGASN